MVKYIVNNVPRPLFTPECRLLIPSVFVVSSHRWYLNNRCDEAQSDHEVIKLISGSAQLRVNKSLLINVKMPTIVLSRINEPRREKTGLGRGGDTNRPVQSQKQARSLKFGF